MAVNIEYIMALPSNKLNIALLFDSAAAQPTQRAAKMPSAFIQ